MRLRNVCYKDFVKETKGKGIICVGAGKLFRDMTVLWDGEVIDRISMVVDNDIYDTAINVKGRRFWISPVNKIQEKKNERICVLITSMYCDSLYKQLNELLTETDIDCYVYTIMSMKVLEKDWVQEKNNLIIPPIIHYFWFGENKIPEQNQKCIDSWKKYCPNYEIIKWSENNYDVSKCKYMKQAYESKKWGFVPDFARLDVLYEFGGIYLDTDVELIKSIDDLLYEKAFVGFQRNYYINLGLGFGCEKNMDIFAELRDDYYQYEFIQNGKLNLLASPYYQTMVLKRHGLKNDNTYQKVGDITIFPTDFFDPMGYPSGKIKLTNNTHSIHHYAESWTDQLLHQENKKRYDEVTRILDNVD